MTKLTEIYHQLLPLYQNLETGERKIYLNPVLQKLPRQLPSKQKEMVSFDEVLHNLIFFFLDLKILQYFRLP